MALPTLADPLYYLANFRTVLDWLEARYADLLDGEERRFIEHFATLPQSSQALLVRMVMRKGVDFRASRLRYAEIGDPDAAVVPLIECGFVRREPPLSLSALFALATKPELAAGLRERLQAAGIPRSRGKSEWLAALSPDRDGDEEIRGFSDWLPAVIDTHYRLDVDPLAERFRLMFFGNLRQQWSEFVLADLGVYRFEHVALDATSRAFSRREELEAYLHLHRIRERFDADEPLASLIDAVPRLPYANDWLERRRSRLLYKLAYRLERQGEGERALGLYETCQALEARVRRIRVLETLTRVEEAAALAQAAAEAPHNAAERQSVLRMLPRLRRKLGQTPHATEVARSPHRLDLELPRSTSVELAVARHLSRPTAPVHYVENGLITGLFGLLCWEAIFAPLPGAFFHPFHTGPADLHDADFAERRRERFDHCLARIEAGDYREVIVRRFHAKHGIQSPFVFWQALSEELLTLALACIPARHLRRWCERLLEDPRANRAGMPDLIQFWPESTAYRMIEVKGPGDRLQDNQRRWLAFCAEHEMPVSVCYVKWQAEAVEPAVPRTLSDERRDDTAGRPD